MIEEFNKLSDKEIEDLLTKFLHKDGCSECLHYKKRVIICKSGCIGKFLNKYDNGKESQALFCKALGCKKEQVQAKTPPQVFD